MFTLIFNRKNVPTKLTKIYYIKNYYYYIINSYNIYNQNILYSTFINIYMNLSNNCKVITWYIANYRLKNVCLNPKNFYISLICVLYILQYTVNSITTTWNGKQTQTQNKNKTKRNKKLKMEKKYYIYSIHYVYIFSTIIYYSSFFLKSGINNQTKKHKFYSVRNTMVIKKVEKSLEMNELFFLIIIKVLSFYFIL